MSEDSVLPIVRPLAAWLLLLVLAACATPQLAPPLAPRDRAGSLLEAGETVALRIPAQLMHGHDMTEQSYDSPEGYQPIPTYDGELLLTDRRLLFVDPSAGREDSWLSVPYRTIVRTRPSKTTLLNYIVVWDAKGHADSFVVDARDVQALHRQIGQALPGR